MKNLNFKFQTVDLSDLEDHKETFQHLALYEAALQELTHGTVPFRILRQEIIFIRRPHSIEFYLAIKQMCYFGRWSQHEFFLGRTFNE